jgi:hypothetical protein
LPAAPAATCSAAMAAMGLLKIKIVSDPKTQPIERVPLFNIESTFQKNVYK